MSRVDFDQYAGQYEAILAAQTNFFDGDSSYFARYKIELAQQLVGPVDAILDFGCGIGRSMPHLREVFPRADIVGCDPSAGRHGDIRGTVHHPLEGASSVPAPHRLQPTTLRYRPG